MLIDAHIHTSGVSRCSRRTPAQIIAQCLADGTDGIVLTNHCDISYTKELGYRDWCKIYVEEFYLTKELGEQYGVKVFFGVEVETIELKKVHYLIYGITPEEFLVSPELYLMNQKKLFEYCEANGFALFQAHPYRNGTLPQNPLYLHGVEISCHATHKTTMSESVRGFAKEHNLFISCGSDFHGDTYKAKCGMYISDDVSDEKMFKEYICRQQVPLEVFEIIHIDTKNLSSGRSKE